jgi:hypothetical protein
MSKHCTICEKAGYPEEVFKSHFIRETRDPGSKVTCPVLKFNICSNCGKKGHFRNSCRVTAPKPKVQVQIQKPKIATKNAFDFGSDSDSEDSEDKVSEEDEASETIEVPFLTKKDSNNIFALNAWQKKYASLLALPERERENGSVFWDAKHQLLCLKGYEIVEKQVRTSSVVETIKVVRPVKRNWADSDSEDD